MDTPKTYEPQKAEEKWYKHWMDKGYFYSPIMFYQVLFHELGHSTMHPSRMNRSVYNLFSSPVNPHINYDFHEAQEEIVAIIFAMKVCALSVQSEDDLKEMSKALWINSFLFIKFAIVIDNERPKYDYFDLERQADEMLDYMLKQTKNNEKTNKNH